MAGTNYYDVTEWHVGDPYEDIGQVINSIIDDVKKRQTEKDVREGGKPGAVIYIPVGDYHLRTQVVIDISYLEDHGIRPRIYFFQHSVQCSGRRDLRTP